MTTFIIIIAGLLVTAGFIVFVAAVMTGLHDGGCDDRDPPHDDCWSLN